MRDMVAQCDSNMSELQQLQVPPPTAPQGITSGPEPLQTVGRSQQTSPGVEWFQTRCAALARAPTLPSDHSRTHEAGVWQGLE